MSDWRQWPGVWRVSFALGFCMMALICLILPPRYVAEGVGFLAERFARFKGFIA